MTSGSCGHASSVVERLTLNQPVVGSIPTRVQTPEHVYGGGAAYMSALNSRYLEVGNTVV